MSDQVQELLRARIQQGTYPPDERMPSEDRLARELNVSRATLRTAMAALAAEGLVRRRHGDGTYPIPHVLEVNVRARDTWNIELQIRRQGRTPSIRTLEQGFRLPSPQERQDLALEDGEQVYVIHRIFLADDTPLMFAVHIVRGRGLAHDFPSQASQLPMLELLNRQVAHRPGSGEVRFKAVPAEVETAAALEVALGSPVLLLEAVLTDGAGEPLLLAWEYYRGQEGFLLPIAPFDR